MPEPLDSKQLRAFVTLARTGSFTQAGSELHLTQSAVSHSMKALESQVGCRLLDRHGKNVSLTQAGEQLLAHATKILQMMEIARKDLEQLGQWGRGRLRIAAGPTACQYILPGVLREFKESFPHCALEIEPGDTPHAIAALHENRVDLALAIEPRSQPSLDFRPLFSDELRFVVSPLHPWAQLGRVVRDEIVHQNLILYSKTSYLFETIQDYFKTEDIVLPRSSIELGSVEAIKELVKIGLGVSILTPWVTRREVQEGSLVTLPLGKRKLKRNWGILSWRGKRLTLPGETFIGLCKSATADL